MKPAPPVIRMRCTFDPSSLPISVNELVEPALATRFRLVLVEEGEFVLVKLLEELIPGDLLERLVRLAEIEPQDSRIVLLSKYPSRASAGRLVSPPIALSRRDRSSSSLRS
jgi:hypothetical protein